MIYAAVGILSVLMLGYGGYLDYRNHQNEKQRKADEKS